MRKLVLLGTMALILSAGFAHAGDRDDDCPGPHCKPKTKDVCFNLVCHYESEKDYDGHKNVCTAASTFIKKVTLDGGEVSDDSNEHNNPELAVTCDGNKTIFNNSARRFTGLLGTRIQGQQGPDPAISLARGALHSGDDGQSGGHYAMSTLELDDPREGFDRMKGKCFIWTGFP